MRQSQLLARAFILLLFLLGTSAARSDPPDSDGDSVPDSQDCAPLTPGISQLPAEIGNDLAVTKVTEGSSTARLSWSRSVQGRASSVFRGAIVPGQPWSEAACLSAELPGTETLDPDVPADGEAFYYLVAAVNRCGTSAAGHASDGTPNAASPCPPQDLDSDVDGVPDLSDNCVFSGNAPQADGDHDFAGTACDVCPSAPDPGQADGDGDGIGDACELAPPSQVAINEVGYDAGPQSEFVELFVAQGPADLTGFTLTDGDEETFTFSADDPRFGCPEPFVLQSGDHVVVWQGSGTAVCTGPVRQIYLARSAFLQDDGDDLALRDTVDACRDFVRFEAGPMAGLPLDCAWAGPDPGNGGAAGVSLSRRDGLPFLDTDTASDWEASGLSTTAGPGSPGQPNESSADVDGDGVLDHDDNCVTVPNPAQDDLDLDGRGDACDNCPAVSNPGQANADGDADGDACDPCPADPTNDVDGDLVCGGVDNCPAVSNPGQADADGDAQGDACDPCPADPTNDVDGDLVCGGIDNCPAVSNPGQANADGDAQGDTCDPCPLDAGNDADADGVCGNVDNCPAVFNPGQADADLDGIGDACDTGPVLVTIKILEQDIRSDQPTWAQHRQQPTTRIGVRSGNRYRSLGWIDLSSIPAGAVVDDVRLVYWTTSGNPLAIGPNGDVGNVGGTVNVELKKILRAWNYDEPLTYPPSLTDNDTPAVAGETSWNHSIFPQTWEAPGCSGATDSVSVAMVGTVGAPIDTRFDLTAPALVPLVQGWLAAPGTNHGFLLKVSDVNEAQTGTGNRKILCGKGFPLETSTNLNQATAESHRPEARITYHLP